MSYCAPCTVIPDISICTDSINLGTVTEVDTLYYVYLRSLATGYTFQFTITSDGDGLLTLTTGFEFAENTSYELWVNQTGSIDDRENFINNSVTNKCFTVQFLRQEPMPTTESMLYINGLSTILGNSTNTTNVKNLISNKGITKPIFYTGSLLSNSGNRASMRALNNDLFLQGITKRAANVTQSVGAITEVDLSTPAGFNTTCSTAYEKFNTLVQEWEFWHTNDYGDFATFKTNDLAIYNYCQAHGLTYDIYVARCRDYTGTFTDAQVADWIVSKHDTILLVDYVSTSKYNTYKGLSDGIKEQLILIADAAKRANKVQKVVILWASEGNNGDNMGTFFAANSNILAALNGFKTVYNNFRFTNKLSISITGQAIYGLNGIKTW